MSKILVIGANGTVGTELVRLLSDQGHDVVRATSRAPTSAQEAHLNLITGEGLATVFAGIDAAFLLSPPGYTNQNELLNPVIDQAVASGVQKLVLMTAMGANADEAAPFRKVERHLEQSGLAYNIIRPNWFMQNFHTFWIQGILEQGKVLLPVGKAKGSFIDARDIAAVVSVLLTQRDRDNQDFDLTGGEALDHDEVAALLSNATGRTIVYEEISDEAMLAQLLATGLPTDYAHFLITILGFFKAGYSEAITPAVETITGTKPRAFAAYAQDFKDAWVV
ncbi:SDR family oxidoreductase [Aquidulcibacter sp.]|uniref:SDR family oxidoreductase n=1 Tax=Aquidulcibacter sp. TaxID=2052990 RepID=UPI0025BFE371|nr:SDR family oxidoreductase [Aquidulcibacter sp.]MCA3693188.1 SDR family oxidoreductase [Aquidulcibacter sp.]